MRRASGEPDHDVIVVGAGPGGCAAALGLARRGARVLLIDRQSFPRAKPCGDCLSPDATRVLDRMGLLAAMDALEPARLEGWRIAAPDGGAFRGGFAAAAAARRDSRIATALALPRERLDHLLVSAAVDAGAELRTGLRVEHLVRADGAVRGVVVRDGDGGRHRLLARLVVGADGLRSVVARRAGATARPGPLRKLSLTTHPHLPGDFTRGLGEMHVVPQGCIGLAPVQSAAFGARIPHNLTFVASAQAWRALGDNSTRATASVGTLGGDTADGGAADGGAAAPSAVGDRQAALMVAMLRAAPGLADRLPALLDALAVAPPPLASGPFDRPVRFAIGDGFALVGDAAGYYDPFTGQGVCHALRDGERLADVAALALENGTGPVRSGALRPYARQLAAWRRPARAVQRTIEFVTARPSLMNRFTRALAAAPAFADSLIATTGDITPVRTLAGAPIVGLGAALLRGRQQER